MLSSILEVTSTTTSVTIQGFLICSIASLIMGVLASMIYMYRNSYNKSFVITLALMPAMIQIVIMLVNGNLGTGVAVMGAFSLVRFRSVPGTAREISSIFFAMGIGLATGMGYIGFAAAFLLLIGIATVLLINSGFGKNKMIEKELKITIPENIDYNGIFDDLFVQYTLENSLEQVRTTNMGSLFELRYRIELKHEEQEKEFLDALRCRNGNLPIICGRNSGKGQEFL